MIGSRHRFHGHASLNNFYSRSRTVRLSSLMLMRYQATTRHTGYRAAVIVSRKVHKSAVVRNRIRRRLYAILEPLEPRFKQSYDLVFLVKDVSIAEVPYGELESLVQSQLKQAGVIEAGLSDKPHDIVNKVQKEN